MKSRTYSLLAATAVAGLAIYFGLRQSPPAVPAASAAVAAPRPTLSSIRTERNPIRESHLFMEWLDGISAPEAAAAAEQIWAMPGVLAEITERKRLFCYAWGLADGAAALEFARNRPGTGKVAALGAALAGWASVDPEAAKSWVASRLAPGEQLMYAWALVEGWARKDPDAATAYALSMKGLPNAGRFIQTIALEQVRRDSIHAGAWALSLPEGSLRSAAVDEVATHWSRVAPAAAVDWALTLPGNALAVPALKKATTEWARIDSPAAGAWLNQMPASALRDQAVAAFCKVLAVQNLDNISLWAQTIADTTIREQSLLHIAAEWMDRNPVATLAWLPQSGLSEAAQQKLAASK